MESRLVELTQGCVHRMVACCWHARLSNIAYTWLHASLIQHVTSIMLKKQSLQQDWHKQSGV